METFVNEYYNKIESANTEAERAQIPDFFRVMDGQEGIIVGKGHFCLATRHSGKLANISVV